MRVLPILTAGMQVRTPFCTVDEACVTIWNCAEFPSGAVILESMISGGSFYEYLEHAIKTYDAPCLYLQPRIVRFPLPCHDGCGEDLPCAPSDADNAVFSNELMCKYIFCKNGPSVILIDDEDTLAHKYRAAMELGLHYFIAPQKLLEKIKTP